MRPSQVLLCTTDTLEGFRITRYWGLVHGNATWTPTVGDAFAEAAFGGEDASHVERSDSLRLRATGRLSELALRMGGNAVLGLRYEISDPLGRGAHVLCYGTAVSVERIQPAGGPVAEGAAGDRG